jgi:DNA-directed RNA polymerase subunit alpha
MRLEVTGEGRVCAGDISTSADFEIVNPELHLATLDAADSTLSIEFNVEPGTGYQPAVQNEGIAGLPVGVLPVDAIFNPVRKVDYHVERTRVGQVTDYERLVLEVWTDGTIAPREAIREAAETLVNHFFLFSNLNPNVESQQDRPSLTVTPEVYQTPIERLDLSPRTLNCLKRAHITKVGEVLEMSDDELLKIRNFGEKSLEELREKLVERGIAAPGAEGGDSGSLDAEAGGLASLTSQDFGELMGIGEPAIGGAAAVAEHPEAEAEDDDLSDWPSAISGDDDDEEENL